MDRYKPGITNAIVKLWFKIEGEHYLYDGSIDNLCAEICTRHKVEPTELLAINFILGRAEECCVTVTSGDDQAYSAMIQKIGDLGTAQQYQGADMIRADPLVSMDSVRIVIEDF